MSLGSLTMIIQPLDSDLRLAKLELKVNYRCPCD